MGLRSAISAFFNEFKASAAGPLIVAMDGGRARATPRRYDKLAEEGYQKNTIVFRCVNLISEEAAAIPWQLFSGQGDDRTEIEAHPLLDLLHKPNPLTAGASFFQHVYSFRLLSGNSYIEAVTVGGGANPGRPLELWTHRPERMKVKPSKSGQIRAYVFEMNGRKVFWEVDEVTQASLILHSKTFNPLNDFYGQSPLEAAATEVDQHNAAGDWNFSLLRNSAKPSGAFVHTPNKDGVTQALDDTQYTRLQDQMERRHMDRFNAGRPMILEGGMDWRQISMSPSEMDWLKGRDMAARDIAMAYDVPPQLVGIEGSQTYANFEQAVLSLYDNAVLPLVDCYKDDLNMWLTPMYGDDLFLDFDLDAIEALAPRRQAKWNNVSTADFLTINEKRQELGFEPLKDAMADQLLVGIGSIPLGMAGQPPEPPASTGNGKDEILALPPPEGGYTEEQIDQLQLLAYGK